MQASRKSYAQCEKTIRSGDGARQWPYNTVTVPWGPREVALKSASAGDIPHGREGRGAKEPPDERKEEMEKLA